MHDVKSFRSIITVFVIVRVSTAGELFVTSRFAEICVGDKKKKKKKNKKRNENVQYMINISRQRVKTFDEFSFLKLAFSCCFVANGF